MSSSLSESYDNKTSFTTGGVRGRGFDLTKIILVKTTPELLEMFKFANGKMFQISISGATKQFLVYSTQHVALKNLLKVKDTLPLPTY